MDLRVTAQVQVNRAVSDIQRLTSDRNRLIEQISSGIRLAKPSDGPSDFVSVLTARAQNSRLDTYFANITNATGELNEGVSILTNVHKDLSRASQIAQEGINSSTDTNGYEALASELDGIITRVLDLGNAKVNNRFLFSGTATNRQPFVVTSTDGNGRPLTVGYQGSDDRAKVTIGSGLTVDTNYAGNQVFQSSGNDVFQALIGLRDDLRNTSLGNNAKAQALTQRLSQLESVRQNVLDSVGQQSASLTNLEALQVRTKDLQLNLQIRSGELESTDYSEAVVLLQQQDSIFQATTAVTAKLFDPGLLRFIQ